MGLAVDAASCMRTVLARPATECSHLFFNLADDKNCACAPPGSGCAAAQELRVAAMTSLHHVVGAELAEPEQPQRLRDRLSARRRTAAFRGKAVPSDKTPWPPNDDNPTSWSADLTAAAPSGDLAALLTSVPRHVAWRERRRFDPATARREGVWSPAKEGTNLNSKDREIIADICFSSDSVFETGVGESTKICAFTGVPRHTGVDNALKWLQNAMEAAPAHYRFHWADIGPIGGYSYPTDPKSQPKWPLSSFAALAAEETPFDVYFVDGRFRLGSPRSRPTCSTPCCGAKGTRCLRSTTTSVTSTIRGAKPSARSCEGSVETPTHKSPFSR